LQNRGETIYGSAFGLKERQSATGYRSVALISNLRNKIELSQQPEAPTLNMVKGLAMLGQNSMMMTAGVE
jgi:hypothetical protein